MSIPTISSPSTPLKCYPDNTRCHREGAECQFSFKVFQYVCCKDKKNIRVPECPRYHDSMRSLCGKSGNNVNCQKGYQCLKARNHDTIEMCCRPNNKLTYPEPETTFVDHYIVPERLPYAPLHSINIEFGELVLTEGQLIEQQQINDLLNKPPNLSGYSFSDEMLYSVIIIGLPYEFTQDTAADYQSTVYWFDHDIISINGDLYFDRDLPQIVEFQNMTIFADKRKNSILKNKCCKVPYVIPGDEVSNGGIQFIIFQLITFTFLEIYTMVLAVYQQKKSLNLPSVSNTESSYSHLPKVNFKPLDTEKFYMKKFLYQNTNYLNPIPVAGNFYGVKRI
uniref:EB domain-containing protein n=1 Tax=Rhabditophanes sp. KR3021 TaxID=114890 RepID=A0AC35TXQ5_9BILA